MLVLSVTRRDQERNSRQEENEQVRDGGDRRILCVLGQRKEGNLSKGYASIISLCHLYS